MQGSLTHAITATFKQCSWKDSYLEAGRWADPFARGAAH